MIIFQKNKIIIFYTIIITLSLYFIAEKERKNFMSGLNLTIGEVHVVHRENLYNTVMDLYSNKKDQLLSEYPFYVEFHGEQAVDIGGVSRDMFSAFFAEMYICLFDGSSLLYPAVNASIDLNLFDVIGTILSHAYLLFGIFPDRIAFPCLASIFLGPTTILTDAVLHESFLCSLCVYDASILQRGLAIDNELPFDLQQKLLTILSSHGCREIPKTENLKRLVVQAARYTFLIRPAAALSMLNRGIPHNHISFWNNMSQEHLFDIYCALSVSTSKVLDLIEEPSMSSSSQEEVWSYLRQFVGNLPKASLRTFLRFVTGSFVISVPYITVTFNTLQGLARRPISHTCSSILELPSTYQSLPEFVAEFEAILADASYSWSMDSI